MQKSLLLEALEIVTCHWGGWVSKEDVTISKQTFRVVLYSLRRPFHFISFIYVMTNHNYDYFNMTLHTLIILGVITLHKIPFSQSFRSLSMDCKTPSSTNIKDVIEDNASIKLGTSYNVWHSRRIQEKLSHICCG